MSTSNHTTTAAVFALVKFTRSVDPRQLQSVIITDTEVVLGIDTKTRDATFNKVAGGWVIKPIVIEHAIAMDII